MNDAQDDIRVHPEPNLPKAYGYLLGFSGVYVKAEVPKKPPAGLTSSVIEDKVIEAIQSFQGPKILDEAAYQAHVGAPSLRIYVDRFDEVVTTRVAVWHNVLLNTAPHRPVSFAYIWGTFPKQAKDPSSDEEICRDIIKAVERFCRDYREANS